MDHRLAGVGVLILVVVAAAVVPGLARRRVAGSAVAERFPDPPAIGDCATSAPSGQGGSFGEPSNLDASAVTWGPCDGPLIGEVVSVQSSDQEPMSPQAGSEGPCFRATAAFAGLEVAGPSVAVPGAPSTGALSWGAHHRRDHPASGARRRRTPRRPILASLLGDDLERSDLPRPSPRVLAPAAFPTNMDCAGTEQISTMKSI